MRGGLGTVTDLLLRRAQASRAGAQGDDAYDVIGTWTTTAAAAPTWGGKPSSFLEGSLKVPRPMGANPSAGTCHTHRDQRHAMTVTTLTKKLSGLPAPDGRGTKVGRRGCLGPDA